MNRIDLSHGILFLALAFGSSPFLGCSGSSSDQSADTSNSGAGQRKKLAPKTKASQEPQPQTEAEKIKTEWQDPNLVSNSKTSQDVVLETHTLPQVTITPPSADSPSVWMSPSLPRKSDNIQCVHSFSNDVSVTYSWQLGPTVLTGEVSSQLNTSQYSVLVGDVVRCKVEGGGLQVWSPPISIGAHTLPEAVCQTAEFTGQVSTSFPSSPLCVGMQGSSSAPLTWAIESGLSTCSGVTINSTTGALNGTYSASQCTVAVKVQQAGQQSQPVSLKFNPALVMSSLSSPVLTSQCLIEHSVQVTPADNYTYTLSQTLTSSDLGGDPVGTRTAVLGASDQKTLIQNAARLQAIADLSPPASSPSLQLSTTAVGVPLGNAQVDHNIGITIQSTPNSSFVTGALAQSKNISGGFVQTGTDLPRASCQLCTQGIAPKLSGAGLYVSNTDQGGSSCAVEASGVLYCTGYNNFGQLGRGTTYNNGSNNRNEYQGFANFADPVVRPGQDAGQNPPIVSEKIVSLAAGARHNCYLVESALPASGYDVVPSPNPALSKAVRCFGSHHFGQKGNGDSVITEVDTVNKNDLKPTLVKTTSGAFLTDVEQIASALYSTCARKVDGSVWCWGRSDAGTGLLTRGTDGTQDIVARETLPASAQIEHVAMGGYHACVLNSSHQVFCWGQNTVGQRGNAGASVTNNAVLNQVNLNLPTGVVVRQLHAGLNFTCAALSDGNFSCWGGNSKGQLNDNPTVVADAGLTNVTTPKSIAIVQNAPDTGWYFDGKTPSQLITGLTEHICAVTTDRSLYCWGKNDKNQSRPSNSPASASGTQHTPSLIVFGSGSLSVLTAAVTYESTCAFVLNGSASQLRCFGENDKGNLGFDPDSGTAGNQNVTDASSSLSRFPWGAWKSSSSTWPYLTNCLGVSVP